MTPSLHLEKLRGKKAWEFAIRFGFGGAVSVAAQLIARGFGPEIAGLFLAFPAILPASLTLVRQHDGPAAAAKDALGATMGSAALGLFAACIWKGMATHTAAAVLPFAAILWMASGAFLWWVFLSRVSDR